MCCVSTVWPEIMTNSFRVTIAPGVKPANFNIDDDINVFQCSFGHINEGLMREPAKQKNVNLISTLEECQWYTKAMGCAKPISTPTGTRAAKLGGRDSLDFYGENSVQSIEGKKYMLMIRDGFTRFIAVYFICSKDEVSIYFKRYLANYYYFTAVPCPVEIVGTDDAAEFKSWSFANLSREQGNMQIIRDGFTRFVAVYFIRSKDEVSIYFKRYLANYYYFTAVPCPVEIVRTDDAADALTLFFKQQHTVSLRVDRLLIFRGNGVTCKRPPLQTVRSLMV